MKLLRRWAFVNGCALAVGIASLFVYDLPAKMAAEPSLANYLPNFFLAGVIWLILAIIRFVATPRDYRN